MQLSSSCRAIAVTLLLAVITPFDSEQRVKTIALTNQANVSSSSLTALTGLRSLRESRLNHTLKTNKIVMRQAYGQNFTEDNAYNYDADSYDYEPRAAPNQNDPDKDDIVLGNLLTIV